jgi:hypothetical protein
MKKSSLRDALAIVVLAGAAFAAQPDRPVVTMTIAPAGEKPHEVEVRESGLAAVKVKGTEFGFRPTIQDSKPWTRVVVTIFRMDPEVEAVGEVEVKTGGPAVQSKTNPGFTIAVTKVVEKP